MPNKDYAEIETDNGNLCTGILNSHAKPIPPVNRDIIEYDSSLINPLGKVWNKTNWVDADTLLSLVKYKTKHKNAQKIIGKKVHANFKDDFASAAEIETHRSNMKAYFIAKVRTPINAAVDKAGVDAAVALIDWESV